MLPVEEWWDSFRSHATAFIGDGPTPISQPLGKQPTFTILASNLVYHDEGILLAEGILQKRTSIAAFPRPIPISFIFLVAAAVHLPLLLMQLPLKSYDTNLHIFFASHYVHHWFDPWNPKWFAGFSQTTYPPLPQQWVAVLSWILGLNMAYMAVQFVAILLLVAGVYRFARLWVSPRAASFAALASVFLGSESFLVYSAGQLSTTVAAPIYLNALPYFFDWLRHGKWRSFIKASVLLVTAAAAHHATLLFGSMFFALPVIALVLLDDEGGEKTSVKALGLRTLTISVVVVIAIAVVLLPFWIALIRYPVTQTPIPHPSRANYILSPQWGLNYFIVPYGALVLALPFIIIRGCTLVRLRPLLLGFWLAFLVGLGGTTPVGHLLLGRAYEVLTFERFSYWATLLSLPIVGLILVELVDKFRMRGVIPLALLAISTCALAVGWSTFRPADAANFNVDAVAQWLNRDGHDRYRYITLGFGNKLSRLAIMTDANSVDGESNSARMLPELTQFGGAALTSSKYFAKPGLDSLRAVLHHADRYGLKWVIVRDSYYDPLLYFAGWRQVDALDDNTITIWGKDGVPPAAPMNSAQIPPHWQGVLWGTLPIGFSILAILVVLIPDKIRRDRRVAVASMSNENLVSGGNNLVSKGGLLAIVILGATVVMVAIGTIWPVPSAVAYAGGGKESLLGSSSTPQAAVEKLGAQIRLQALNKAYSSLSNKAEFTEAQFVHDLTGYALSLRTYATLDGFEVKPLHQSANDAEATMKLRWSTVVGTFDDTRDLHLINNGGHWTVNWPLVPQQHVPPQVIRVNYLRWDVIYSGAGDDWGAQDVEAPHVRIVDMHPVNRADGVFVMGELLNEDVVPAFVSVRATLLAKNGSPLASEGAFDMISHTLLPKQVTPFIIRFSGIDLSQVGEHTYGAYFCSGRGLGRSGDRDSKPEVQSCIGSLGDRATFQPKRTHCQCSACSLHLL